MTGVSIDTVFDELPVRGDEPGTAPGDRPFRPDVEGLRAVAIVLVVLYHGGLKALSGGYVGVDVFFVISGFVITGLLLRERASSGTTSFLSFYGRRSRRIIPAATLVIVLSIIATYWILGAIYGNPTAVDGRWTAVFLANFHFASVGTNYLNQAQPPSPLLNFWSLAVEEQFYLVYPALFVALAMLGRTASFRVRLGIGLVVVIAASFTLSVLQTNSDPTVAYFSPFTRAWELALGALVAVATPMLLRAPRVLSGVVTWLGLGAIAFSAVAFGAGTAYPGSLVAIPVLGAALVIAGGMAAPKWAAESVLGLSPMRWVGRISYSLYLWHWPILIIAADQAGKTSLPFSQNMVWLLVALALSVVTYALVENPIRHAKALLKRRWSGVALGAVLVAMTIAIATLLIDYNTARFNVGEGAGKSLSSAAVLLRVKEASSIRSLPADLVPPLTDVSKDLAIPTNTGCWLGYRQWKAPACVFGDRHGTQTMVLYGDSHAGMWFDAVDAIATRAHWRLIFLGKAACPVNDVELSDPLARSRLWAACDRWRTFAVNRISNLRPNLVVVSQESPQFMTPTILGGRHYTPSQWQRGLEHALREFGVPASHEFVIGNIPETAGPDCLSRHSSDVQACSVPIRLAQTDVFNPAELAATLATHANYIDVTPWFCSDVCSEVVGRYVVYWDSFHVTSSYSVTLEGVLAKALDR